MDRCEQCLEPATYQDGIITCSECGHVEKATWLKFQERFEQEFDAIDAGIDALDRSDIHKYVADAQALHDRIKKLYIMQQRLVYPLRYSPTRLMTRLQRA